LVADVAGPNCGPHHKILAKRRDLVLETSPNDLGRTPGVTTDARHSLQSKSQFLNVPR